MKTTMHAGAAAFQPPCETANFKGGWKAAPPSSRGVAILMLIAESMRNKYSIDGDVSSYKGLLWSSKVEDEQGKLNVNNAPPQVIGNLIASALLSDGIKRGDTQLPVDDASMFNRNGGIVFLL